MRSIFVIPILLLLSVCLFGGEAPIDVSNLSPEQIQQVKSLRDTFQNKPTAVQVREEAAEWAKIGANLGNAMVGAAKELGVAAADFARTPLGMIVIFILVLKLIGGPIIGIVLGLLLIYLGHRYNRYVQNHVLRSPVYEIRPILWGLCNRQYIVKFNESSRSDGDIREWALAFRILGTIAGTILAVVSAWNF
jgi:hypothetical protein